MQKKGSLSALLPLLVFLIVYVGLSVIAGDMYAVSVIIPFSAAAFTAIFMRGKESLTDKIEIFCKGAGDSNVILMILILKQHQAVLQAMWLTRLTAVLPQREQA